MVRKNRERKKTCIEKLKTSAPHEIKRMKIDIAGMKKGEMVLVPSVAMIDAFIKTIPHGTSVSIANMRKELARKYKAEVTCPIYTGYHLRTIAEAAFEAHERGVPLDKVTPVWRLLDDKAPTFKKLSPDKAQIIARQRTREGLD